MVWGEEGSFVQFPPIADASREDSSPGDSGSHDVLAPMAAAAMAVGAPWSMPPSSTLTGGGAHSVVSAASTPAHAIAAMSLNVPGVSPPAALAARRAPSTSPFMRLGVLLGNVQPPPVPPAGAPAPAPPAIPSPAPRVAASPSTSRPVAAAAAAMLAGFAAAKSVLWSRS